MHTKRNGYVDPREAEALPSGLMKGKTGIVDYWI